ncbi:nidogen-like domain-containing protein [Rheinheimera sp. MMS21-TC3]|uniref:nidogen-like domain-containing protein n=1 Tax=Rheinheimera sp. MMS21-TC3 TaxID=3072790 RepID=UPI0028C3A83A|nr:nidogen-like domain-containing protein [Rheinheimera sp. MMS21-TC3]WNO59946.1 nidogen-like domain-containing protein [Rheinheimera sp. MMS21-TC3]
MLKKTLATGLIALSLSAPAFSSAIINDNTLAANDDGSTGPVSIGFSVDFFGLVFNDLFVNNNGNITFDSTLSAYTPFDLTSTGQQNIAPFFADVDTRNNRSEVTYGTGTFSGFNAFGVNWVNVDYFASNQDHTNFNSFQLILVERSDFAVGDFDIVFNYDNILWEAGTANDSDENGLGGFSARAGFSNGTGAAGTQFEMQGSAINGAFLNGGPNALISNRYNSTVDGRYIFSVRNGNVITDPEPNPVPESGTLILMVTGLMLVSSRKFLKKK